MKIAIVDTLTLTLNGAVYGHFNKVSLQLLQVLSKNFEAKIVAGKTYSKYFDESKLEIIPWITTKENFDSKSFLIKIKTKLKSFINTFLVLRKRNYDVLIFHDNNQSLLYFLLLFFKPAQHIILIRYTENQSGFTSFLYRLIKSKLSFIITSLDNVAKSYQIDYVVIPDYLPTIEFSDKLPETLYDFVLVGTISACKDIEDVLMSVFNSDFTVKVAGHFENEEQYERLNQKYENNNRINIENKYLSEVEYSNLIKKGRFVVLPYKLNSYINRSSGVILDAIYSGRPIIGTNIEAFAVIKREKLGFVYDNSLSEVISIMELNDYDDLLYSVSKYRDSLKSSIFLLTKKIDNLN